MPLTRMQRALPGPDDTLRETLPNGITVLARENFASPAVVIHGYLEAGGEDESLDQLGLANFTLDVMERGTHRRSFEQLYTEVEAVGASFGLGAGSHLTTFTGKSLAKHLPMLCDVISDVLRNPAFPNEQVTRARGEILSAIRELKHNTRAMANEVFHTLIYPENHPYHWNNIGREDTIASISREALVDFHKRFFTPRGMVIAIVGAVKVEEALKAVKITFADWDKERPTRTPLPPVPPLRECIRKEVPIPDKTQSDLVLGWVGPPRRSADFMTCHLANTVLGTFGMMGRLGETVRSQNGLAYYVYSRVDGGTGPGPWRAIAGVDPNNVDRTVTLILQEIQKLREELIPAGELADSKSYLTGSLPLHLETNEGVAQALTNIERYDLGLDYLQRYRATIEAITATEVQAAVQRWMDTAQYAVAIAGPELGKSH
ncbi:MAG: insulinase family protein [Anaerolineae bacterium]|nr:insulinase family protein [Anaerolineae bacterium]